MPKLNSEQQLESGDARNLLNLLKDRFEKNPHRHKGIEWIVIHNKLKASPGKLWSLSEMEKTGGEPDVVGYDATTDQYHFVDCSTESPQGRRSVCYDRAGLESRKEFKPSNNAIGMANSMGVEILNETQFRELQKLGSFDTKTSSWLATPDDIRKLGGALFGDCRYGRVFIYHNGAQSYYSGRGFRGLLRV